MEKELEREAKQFWKDHEKDDSVQGLFVDKKLDETAFRRCLARATADITARTLAVNESDESAISEDKRKTDALVEQFMKNKIYNKFGDWFAPIADPAVPKPDFDTWHHEACELVLKAIQKRYPTAKYGKAQKVINMTFKTMYSLVAAYPPSFEVEPFFEPCHMPLDSFTLEWLHGRKYSNSGRKEVLQPNPARTKAIKGSATLVQDTGYYASSKTEWSNIHWNGSSHYIGSGKDAKYTYTFYVEEIRNLFDNCDSRYGQVEEQYKKYTPLQAEFFIWEKMQYIRAAKEIAAALGKFCKNYPRIRTVAEEHIENNPDLQKHINEIKASLSCLGS